MSDFLASSWLDSSWFIWAVVVAVGLPLVLIVLTELHAWLVRGNSRMARPVAMLRNFIIPALALLLLLTKASGLTREVTTVRVVATVFAFLLMLFVLSGVNVLLFGKAQQGSWRKRMPSIFIDIGRLVVVAVGLAILLSQVWGADVGGLFAALGVTSIVIGLALQNAVGSVIAGLLLLFEQPFTLGDWLQVSTTRGRVIEVNWRAVHLDTGTGIQIIPNSSLATSSFTNLSQPSLAVDETITLAFGKDDSPAAVCELLEETAGQLPMIDPDTAPVAALTGPGTYAVTLHLKSLTDAGQAESQLRTWLWYASRRVGLHHDGADPDTWATADRVLAATRAATALMLRPEDIEPVAARARLIRYGRGETVQRLGAVPTHLNVVVAGQVSLGRPNGLGVVVPLSTVETNGFVSPTAMTTEPATMTAVAASELEVLQIPVDVVEALVSENSLLARDLSAEIDRRRTMVDDLTPDTAGLSRH